MGGNVNLISPEGDEVSAPAEQAEYLIRSQKYRAVAPSEELSRGKREGEIEGYGINTLTGGAKQAVSEALGGATLGATTWLQSLDPARRREIQLAREERPVLSTAAQVIGAALPTVVSGGTALPAGAAARAAELGAARFAGKGALAEIAGAGVSYGAAGAAENLGHYIANQAVEDKDVTAEGALGALGMGALWAGGPGAVLAGASRGATRLKKLFPEGSVTAETATAAERKAVSELQQTATEGADLELAGEARLRANRHKSVTADPAVAAHAEAVRAEKLGEAAAKRQGAEALAAQRGTRAESEVVKLERLKAGKQKKGAPLELDLPPPIEAPAVKGPPGGTLEEQLAASVERLKAGEPIEALAKEGRAPRAKPTRKSLQGGDPEAEAAMARAARSELDKAAAERAAAGARRMEPEALAAEQSRRAAPSADVERAIDDAVAELNPEMAKLRNASAEHKAARKDYVRDWVADVKQKAIAGMERKVASGELPREKAILTEWLGEPTLRRGGMSDLPAAEGHAFQRMREYGGKMLKPYSAEEQIAKSLERPTFRDFGGAGEPLPISSRNEMIDRILTGESKIGDLQIEALGDVGGKVKRMVRPATSADVIHAASKLPGMDEAILNALRGRMDGPDAAKGIASLQRYEKAEADLVDALGHDLAPQGAVRRTQEYRAMETEHAATRSLADRQQAEVIEQAASPAVAKQLATHGAPSKAADALAMLDLLSDLSIPGLPSAKDIPVVGPLLSLYLKGRAMSALWRKAGGKIGSSVETELASKAAATRNRMNKAVRGLLDVGSTVAKRTLAVTPAASILSQRMFADERDGKHRAGKATMAELWQQRAAELERAQQPGAIAASLRDRIRTSDPRLGEALVAVEQRRVDYLASKMPKPPPQLAPGAKARPWRPPDAEVAEFARVVEAVNDPVLVLERAKGGVATVSQIDAVRNVYPRLYSEAQQMLLEGLLERDDVPYRQRIQLGTLFGVPLDDSEVPEFAAEQQAAMAQSAAPPPPPQPKAPPSPGISAPLTKMANQSTLQEDR